MKKGFLLLETIVVIAVLCTVLITLYVGYNNTTNAVKAVLNYDNTEYLYKTYVLSKFLGEKIINEGSYACSNCESIHIFCSDKGSVTKCSNMYGATNSDDEQFLQNMINSMHVKAIYITPWDTTNLINRAEIMNMFEATTGRYIKSLNPDKRTGVYRIIVMFEDSNSSNAQYASLEFASAIRSVS